MLTFELKKAKFDFDLNVKLPYFPQTNLLRFGKLIPCDLQVVLCI